MFQRRFLFERLQKIRGDSDLFFTKLYIPSSFFLLKHQNVIILIVVITKFINLKENKQIILLILMCKKNVFEKIVINTIL